MSVLDASWGQALIDKVKLELTKKVDKASGPHIFAGTIAFADRPTPGADNNGFVYNISDAFTTTSDFVDGAGIECAAGTDIVVVKVPALPNPIYKWDVYGAGGGELDYITDDDLDEMWKDPGSVTMSKDNVSLAVAGTDSVTLTDATGALSITNSDSVVATAALDTTGTDPVINFTGASAGTCVITVAVASSSTNRAASFEINVTVS